MNGKGDAPRNCFSKQYKENFDQIDWSLKLSSEQWCVKLGIDKTKIIDPDGWDRSNFEASWNEKITEKEFLNRLQKSTTHARIR